MYVYINVIYTWLLRTIFEFDEKVMQVMLSNVTVLLNFHTIQQSGLIPE